MTGDVGKLYAQALFELSLESESLENVCFELKQCREIFDENPQLVKLLSCLLYTSPSPRDTR